MRRGSISSRSNEWQAYAADLHRVVHAIVSVCKPDHMNIESLGNLMPHLHWHVIPRYKNDGRWGQPIWAPDVTAQPDRRLAPGRSCDSCSQHCAPSSRRLPRKHPLHR